MTPAFQERLAKGETLDDLLPEAFAVVREAAKRTLGQRHFDVQLVGGMVLHDGNIAEMKTGEGKTLVATLPVYLNALAGEGVHVVTVNDYLAKRDSEWMGQIYRFLGLSVGCIVHGLTDEERRDAYAADVTYGTNNEFGFDYLRDNMKYSLDDDGPARPCLCHRRRSRLHPGRRSAHAADHFRPDRRPDRDVPRGRCADAAACVKGDYELDEKASARSRSPKPATSTWSQLLRGAGLLETRRSLRHREHHHRPSREPGAEGAQAVPEGQGLHRQERPGRSSSTNSPAA